MSLPISMKFVRAKIYGHELSDQEIEQIISDITLGNYSDVHISAFLTACSGNRLSQKEILALTKAMIKVGHKLDWDENIIVDKHCIGGLPGNRTTPIVVAIVAAFGLKIPKTSSRAITSPAGTADTMEVLSPVELDIEAMQRVVRQENGCIVWGGAVSLSPADDILIRVERALDLDSEGQMIASILSKKIAAGSTHVLIEIPVGSTAKVRSQKTAKVLQKHLRDIAENLGVKTSIILTDGSQPVGNGIGPALEARDLLAVLQNDKNAPQDLRQRALLLAGKILEFSPKVLDGQGMILAQEILDSGRAWQKFQSICAAQGGIRTIPQAKYQHKCQSISDGTITEIDNRRIAMIAKIAGAPNDKAAGVDLLVNIGNQIRKNDVLFIIHSNSVEALETALAYFSSNYDLIKFRK